MNPFKTRKSAGRPPLPKSERKKVFPLRISGIDEARFKRIALSQGMTIREWIANVLEEQAAAYEAALRNSK